MAKVLLTLDDTLDEKGAEVVMISSEIKEYDNTQPATQSMIIALAIKKLFQTHWLSKNAQSIVPECFEPVEPQTPPKDGEPQ